MKIGPYIKWFSEKLGDEGLYKLLDGFEDKSGRAVCTFAYCRNNSKTDDVILFQGITSGNIVSPRGYNGFAWNPIFQPDGFDKTYAELSQDVKNKISHRYKAIEKIRKYFDNIENQ